MWRKWVAWLRRPRFWVAALACMCLLLGSIYAWVSLGTAAEIYDDIDTLPPTKTLVLLGTSKRLSDGSANPFFDNRIATTVALYRAGKVHKVIVSGDHSSNYYNEPQDMRRALLQQQVPADIIYLDLAGYRTFDSVLRARTVFGEAHFVIVSQRFHVERALFIAQTKGIAAIGYAAPDPKPWWFGLRVRAREVLARVSVVLDLYVFDTQPQYPGPGPG